MPPLQKFPELLTALYQFSEKENKRNATRGLPHDPAFDPDLDGGMIRTAVEDASEAVGGAIATVAVTAYSTGLDLSASLVERLKCMNVL